MNLTNIPVVPAKTIIQTIPGQSHSRWPYYNMNIYRGCSHDCIYCDSRSSCFQVDDFSTVRIKEDALEKIRNELRRKVRVGIISTGAMSDPYNPIEETLNLSRNALELINAYGFGAAITTKSALIARDADVLSDIKKNAPVRIMFSICSSDDDVCTRIEPHVSNATQRFSAMATLSDAGIFCGVWLNPMLPYITDNEANIIKSVRMVKSAGGKFIHTFMGMTLRPGSREYYYEQLDAHFPGLKEKYIKQYGFIKHLTSPNARKLWTVFNNECEKQGLLTDFRAIDSYNFSQYKERQMTLF